MKKVNILLICAGGMSTSILMKKMEKYAKENDIELKIEAVGVGAFPSVAPNYDVMLLGPQISYQKKNVAEKSGKPTDVIAPQDYGIGNAAKIFKQVEKLLEG